jgi:hypothetical protein
MTYPAPEHISYDEDSRWCQDHGHTGLMISDTPGFGCEICERLVQAEPRFAAALSTATPPGPHNPDGSLADAMTRRAMDRYGPALDELKEHEV